MKHKFIKIKLNLILAFLTCTLVSKGQFTHSEIADKLWSAVGGEGNWKDARYFMFSCVGGAGDSFAQGERKYIWDKQTGDCRFEGVTTDDEAIIVLFNIKTSTGTAYINGQKLENERIAQDIVHEITDEFEQDAYFLFLPTVLDGSHVTYEVSEEKLIGSQRFTVVDVKNPKTSFEISVDGQLYIDTQTGKAQQWWPRNRSSHFIIGGFKDIGGGLVLPTDFISSDTSTSISYPLAAALVNIEAHKFKNP